MYKRRLAYTVTVVILTLHKRVLEYNGDLNHRVKFVCIGVCLRDSSIILLSIGIGYRPSMRVFVCNFIIVHNFSFYNI